MACCVAPAAWLPASRLPWSRVGKLQHCARSRQHCARSRSFDEEADSLPHAQRLRASQASSDTAARARTRSGTRSCPLGSHRRTGGLAASAREPGRSMRVREDDLSPRIAVYRFHREGHFQAKPSDDLPLENCEERLQNHHAG